MKSAIREQETLIGTFVSIAHPAVVEILAGAGFDYVCIDSEHGAFTATEIEDLVRAADAAGIPALVRVSGVGPEIGRALDSGAAGVIVPRVETAAQAAEAAAATKYPPMGTRGAGPGRATNYGRLFGAYLESANGSTACIVQIETQAGLDQLDAILEVEGIDLAFIGPGDLAVSLGVAAGSEAHAAAVATIHETAAARDVRSGMFTMRPEDVAPWTARGMNLFLVGGDLAFLSAAAKTASDQSRIALSAGAR